MTRLGEDQPPCRRFGPRMFDQTRRLFGPQSVLARTWQVGSMALWMLVMLFTLLVVEYLF
jgi:hypothetical protein